MAYDDQNIFAKILRGEIPCDKIYEDDFVLSFHERIEQSHLRKSYHKVFLHVKSLQIYFGRRKPFIFFQAQI